MNNTNIIRKLTILIFEVTQNIQEKLPELYLLSSETPLLSSKGKKPINVSDLGAYLDTLKRQLQMFEMERKKLR